MSQPSDSTNETDRPKRWKMWVDGCGGFLVIEGSKVRVGGGASPEHCDVCIRADLPRTAGVIHREGEDYFWQGAGQPSSTRIWIKSGTVMGGRDATGLGSASLIMSLPSPLSRTAVLNLKPPHRFGEHVDAVLLVEGAVLIGPTSDCHVRVRHEDSAATLVRRDDTWAIRSGIDGAWEKVQANESVVVGSLSLLLESA
ncbi:hypothetical protein [Rubripirellula amarantea]|uniref:hypothetical protein n=1 Tax=Rubripirellula amarantea TaxID=2527999 RepID=UPI0011B4FC41|nr:hypothetical protein [Rubripirellula amarantea]